MSVAEKYGKPLPVESLSNETLQQVRAVGQQLASSGVVQRESLGSGAPVTTPAMKYGGGSKSLQRELPQRSRSI